MHSALDSGPKQIFDSKLADVNSTNYDFMFIFIILFVTYYYYINYYNPVQPKLNVKKIPKVIIVDGIISAGKSVYVNMLYDELTKLGKKVAIVKEPVDKWKDCGILKRFYADPKRYGYHFQTKAFVDRITENIEMYEKYGQNIDIFICERSQFTDNIFMEMLHESGMVDDLEFQHYKEWWNLWTRIMPYQPNFFIYLTSSVDTAMDRYRRRNREGETLSEEYQMALKAKHDEFFKGSHIRISNDVEVPCVTIDNNRDYLVDESIKNKMVADFINLIEEL